MNAKNGNRRRDPAGSGFTLVEALVATALLAFVLLGTTPLFIRSVTDLARNRNLLHMNGGTQTLLAELSIRYGIDPADGLIVPGAGWRVYNTQGSVPTSANAPIAVNDLFRGAGAAGMGDRTIQNNLVGQLQYQVATLPTGRVQATVELYYFSTAQRVRPVTGTAALTSATARTQGLSLIRQQAFLDQP